MIINQRKAGHHQNRFQNSIVKYLNCAILINPDVATFWNARRQLVEKVQLNITQEFQFSSLVLSKKPKSSEAFFYRRWLFSFQSMKSSYLMSQFYFKIYYFLGGEAIDWAVEISLCERCAERKNGNYHAWNHRQWALQKAPNLLNYEIVKTEKFIRKNIADFSCYHHRHFVHMKLFDLQYFDIHDMNLDELYQFVNAELPEDKKVNNMNDLALYILPNIVKLELVNATKLKSFLFSLNLIAYDLKMIQELAQLHGKYEAFNCYKRILIKFAIDIVQLVNNSNYLMHERFSNLPSSATLEITHGKLQSAIVEYFKNALDLTDERNVSFANIFF